MLDFTYVTLALEDVSSKLAEVVSVADSDAEEHVEDTFGRDFEVEVYLGFWS